VCDEESVGIINGTIVRRRQIAMKRLLERKEKHIEQREVVLHVPVVIVNMFDVIRL
jgi:tartrate dehydratase beta subunit/fumarate hydratase class I family protein